MNDPTFTNFVALDLEFNQPSRRIIQVGVAIGSAGVPEEDWTVRQWLVDPGEPITPSIETLTGITDLAVQQSAVTLDVVASELSAMLDFTRDVFVNPVTWGGGDTTELLSAFAQLDIPFHHFGRRWIDVKTLHVANLLAAGRSTSGGLSSAMVQYRLRFEGQRHRADDDAYNTLRLFFKMQERQRRIDSMLAVAKSL